MREPFKKSLGEIPVEEGYKGGGGRQVILSREDDIAEHLQILTRGFLSSGASFPWHGHQGTDEFFIVLKGAGQVTYQDESGGLPSFAYTAGDIVYIPADVPHGIECTGSEGCEYPVVRLDA